MQRLQCHSLLPLTHGQHSQRLLSLSHHPYVLIRRLSTCSFVRGQFSLGQFLNIIGRIRSGRKDKHHRRGRCRLFENRIEMNRRRHKVLLSHGLRDIVIHGEDNSIGTEASQQHQSFELIQCRLEGFGHRLILGLVVFEPLLPWKIVVAYRAEQRVKSLGKSFGEQRTLMPGVVRQPVNVWFRFDARRLIQRDVALEKELELLVAKLAGVQFDLNGEKERVEQLVLLEHADRAVRVDLIGERVDDRLKAFVQFEIRLRRAYAVLEHGEKGVQGVLVLKDETVGTEECLMR